MKKILFVVPFLSSGGAERVVSIWTSELAKLGYDVHLLVFSRLEREYPLDGKVNIYSIKENKKEYDSLSKWKKIIELRRKFREIKPDLVIPFISYVGLMTSIAKLGLSLEVVETIRNNPSTSPSKKLHRWARNLSVFLAKGCIVQTDEQLEYFPKWMQGRMITIANPIADEFTQKEKIFVEKKIENIIAVGRLERQKNFEMLIRAFSIVAQKNKDIKLNIYGEGTLYKSLFTYIQELNLENRILLHGRTNNITEALLSSDLFILSSDSEGMPNALMEAMAVGLPCISTDCPTGPSELIKNEYNGYLIPVGDEEALVNNIIKVINNIDETVRIGQRARKEIVNKYAARESAKKLNTFIESI
ncbi:TPA: glycosyltransferase [Bacillus cereus]|uniref:glycosyltransferase n=1 Tax=Bacillus anthracis TaxID=1392 RepID=UPI00372EEEA8